MIKDIFSGLRLRGPAILEAPSLSCEPWVGLISLPFAPWNTTARPQQRFQLNIYCTLTANPQHTMFSNIQLHFQGLQRYTHCVLWKHVGGKSNLGEVNFNNKYIYVLCLRTLLWLAHHIWFNNSFPTLWS